MMSYYTLGFYSKLLGDINPNFRDAYLEVRFQQPPTLSEAIAEIKYQRDIYGFNRELAGIFMDAVEKFGIPKIPAGRIEADLTWGVDKRAQGILPLGITNLNCFRIVENHG